MFMEYVVVAVSGESTNHFTLTIIIKLGIVRDLLIVCIFIMLFYDYDCTLYCETEGACILL